MRAGHRRSAPSAHLRGATASAASTSRVVARRSRRPRLPARGTRRSIRHLARLERLRRRSAGAGGRGGHDPPARRTACELRIPMAGLFDVAAEMARLSTRAGEDRGRARRPAASKLENPQFVERAKPEVVAEARERVAELQAPARRRSRPRCASCGTRGVRLSLDPERVRRIVRRAPLDEDVGARDATTRGDRPENAARAGGAAGQAGAGRGGPRRGDARSFRAARSDVALGAARRARATGSSPGTSSASVAGRARAILTARAGGAQLPAAAVGRRHRSRGASWTRWRARGARIRDTRKTTPLLRFLEKHAVEVGGGVPHRSGLDTGILVKDNHVRLAGSVRRGDAARGGRRRRACRSRSRWSASTRSRRRSPRARR